MKKPSDAELAKSKRLWESGQNDVVVAQAMGWSTTLAHYVRCFCLDMKPVRTHRFHKTPKK